MKPELTEREEEIIRVLWENGPMTVRELLDKLPGPKRHFNTVSTFVRMMEQKGYIDHESWGTGYRYFAKISADDYSRSALRRVVSRYFNNSLRGVISALVTDEALTPEQVSELVEQVKRGKED